MVAAWVNFACAGSPAVGREPLVEGKEPLLQGKPLSYWLKELKDPDPLTREEALGVLAGAGETAREAAPLLVELLKDKSASIRVKAALALGQLKGKAKDAAPVLLEAWKDGSQSLRHQILPALPPIALEVEDALLLLLRASADADNQTRFLASSGITNIGPAAADPLVKALDHADPIVRRQAVVHLGNLGPAGKGGVPALRRHLEAKDWDARFQAAHALARIEKNPRAVLDVMVEASSKEDQTIRRAAWEVVLQIKPPAKEALAVYKAALKEGPLPTKMQAAEAVWHITRKADDVLPAYREVIENAPRSGYPAVWWVLTAVKQLGPDAKALRIPLLDILKQGKDPFRFDFCRRSWPGWGLSPFPRWWSWPAGRKSKEINLSGSDPSPLAGRLV